MMQRFAVMVLATVAMVLGSGCQGMKVEPGQVGILVNYSTGEMKEVKPGQFWWNTDPYLHLTTYPVTQQTLVMVQAVKEGKIVGDDSVPCRDNTNNQVSWDIAVTWRVNPDKAKDLYLLKRELPLDDPNSDNDIASQVVRQAARSKIREVCPGFAYTVMEQKRPEIAETYKRLLSGELTQSFLIVDEVYLRDLHMDPKLQEAINNYIAGNNALAQAEFARQKAVKDAETAQVTYELEQRKKTFENDQENLRKVNQAKADAAVVQARMEAEASGNERLARSITPSLVDYVRAQHWNGQGPTTVLGRDQQTLVQVP